MYKTVFLFLFLLSLNVFAGEKGKPQPIPQEESESEGFGFNMGLAAGAVVLDGQLYNQIGIRPLITIGKLGIALDLSIYLDSDGNIRKDNWNDASDIWEKFYFIRWAKPGDPFYLKVGAIDDYRLGYGLLMNHYSNTVEYPNVIRTGMEIGFDSEGAGFQGMVNNFAEAFNGGGLFAGRFVGKFLGGVNVGFSVVADVNQYKGLKDRDGDGVPDFADDFPDNKKYAADTDGDGIADPIDWDRDNNWLRDNPAVVGDSLNEEPNFDVSKLKKPFRINEGKNKDQLAAAVDVGLPIVDKKYLNMVLYTQYAQFFHNGGWGVTAPGLRAKFAFINAFAEYRIFGKKFIPEYFNTTYELERAVPVADSTGAIQVKTKRSALLEVNKKLRGYVIGADFNIGDFIIFGAEYQDMSKSDLRFRTFRSSLDLNASFIPKINKAGAYYIQNNTMGSIFKRSEGTILGYKFGYEIGGGATLLMDFRQTYRDLNGDGKISGSNEVVKSTLVQTVFMF